MEEQFKSSACISKDMIVFKGGVSVENDLVIDGCFYGDIASTKAITISKDAKFKGSIIAESLEVFGEFTGDILVHGVVSLHKGSLIKGTVNCGNIVIEEGAVIADSTTTISDKEFAKRAHKSSLYKHILKAAKKASEKKAPESKPAAGK